MSNEIKIIEMVDVPCGNCHLCCREDAIPVHAELGDDVSLYQTKPHILPELASKGILMLKHKADRTCIHLGKNGCEVHDHKPAMCKAFDCRRMVKQMGYTRARKAIKKGLIGAGILNKGMDMLRKYPVSP